MKESNFITFLNNKQFGARLGSFGLAVFLWLFVVSNNNYSTIINIPMTVFNLGISSKYNQPINIDHNNIEYSKGETTEGDAML